MLMPFLWGLSGWVLGCLTVAAYHWLREPTQPPNPWGTNRTEAEGYRRGIPPTREPGA